MKYLIWLIPMLCLLLFCTPKPTEDFSFDEEILKGSSNSVTAEMPRPETTKYENIGSFVSHDDELFSEIQNRVMSSELSNGYYMYWPREGDTLANIVWALHGKGKNVERIMQIVHDNESITDPNWLRCNKIIKIGKGE